MIVHPQTGRDAARASADDAAGAPIDRSPISRACASWRSTTTAMRSAMVREILEATGASCHHRVAAAALDASAVERPDVADRRPRDAGDERLRLHPAPASSADPAVRDVPAAALTAFARSEDRTRALRRGFQLHLAKPIDPGELMAAMATLVRRARLAR